MSSKEGLQEEAGAVLPGTGEERTAETETGREGGREGGKEGGSWTLCRSLLLRHGESCTSSGVYKCVCVCVSDTGNDGETRTSLIFAASSVQTTMNVITSKHKTIQRHRHMDTHNKLINEVKVVEL